MRRYFLFLAAIPQLNAFNSSTVSTRFVSLPTPAYSKTTKYISQSSLSSSAANMYTIQQSGKYYLNTNLEANPSSTDRSVIKITASNVVLDLSGMTITQVDSNTQAGLNAIDIASGVSNVTIMNGFINKVTDVGVKVASSCNNIRLENVSINNCNGGGAQFNTVSNITLDNVTISNCNGSGTSAPSSVAVGLYLTSCNSITIKDCQIDRNQGTSRNSYNCQIASCTNGYVVNSSFSSASGNVGRGLLSTSSNGFVFENCNINYNTGSTGSGDGGNLTSCIAFTFNNCNFLGNNGVGCSGTYAETCTNLVFDGCNFNYQNSSGTSTALGLYVNGGAGNVIKNCTALSNTGAGVNAFGITVSLSADGVIVDNCICSNNTTTTSGVAYGIYMDSDVTNNTATNNILLNNVGASGNNFGFYDATGSGTGTTTMLGGNISFGHGACSPPDGSNLSNTTGNYYFQLKSPTTGTNSPDVMIQEIKIGKLAESGTTRVTTSGNIGQLGTFDNLSLIQ